jgi:hypothetical protein
MDEWNYTDAKGVEIIVGAKVKPGVQSQIIRGRVGIVTEIRPTTVPYWY